MREAPSLVTIRGLLARGAQVAAHDPEAMEESRKHYLGDDIRYVDRPYDALDGADALIIHTEWHPYRRPDFVRMKELLATPLILDGRNLFRPERMRELGFEYHSVGRRAVLPADVEAGT
jgi:UDPglucose 6-dehydrogenase